MNYTTIKTKGDNAFKSLKFEEAISYYQEAMLAEGSDCIVLNSNISACYYEMGNYDMSIKHSTTVKHLISNRERSDSTEKLLEKNMNRITKCNAFISPPMKLSDESKFKWEHKLNMVSTNFIFVRKNFIKKIFKFHYFI